MAISASMCSNKSPCFLTMLNALQHKSTKCWNLIDGLSPKNSKIKMNKFNKNREKEIQKLEEIIQFTHVYDICHIRSKHKWCAITFKVAKHLSITKKFTKINMK